MIAGQCHPERSLSSPGTIEGSRCEATASDEAEMPRQARDDRMHALERESGNELEGIHPVVDVLIEPLAVGDNIFLSL